MPQTNVLVVVDEKEIADLVEIHLVSDGYRVFKASNANDGLDMDEICERLNIPRTSCYDILVTLVHMGMLEVNTLAKKSYKIGLNAYRIGMSYTNNRNISEIISPALKELAKELKKTCFFGILEGNKIVYISKFEPEHTYQLCPKTTK